MGKLGDTLAVEPLLMLLADPAWWVRSHAAEVLGKLGDQRAVEPLRALTTDSNSSVQDVAAEALLKLEQALSDR